MNIFKQLLVISIVTFYLTLASPYSNDTFRCNWLEYNFGDVTDGDSRKCDLIITNMSKNTLEIEYITTSCKCISAATTKKCIKPNKSAHIRIKFDSTGKSLGENHQSVIIGTSDKRHYVFGLKANVVP